MLHRIVLPPSFREQMEGILLEKRDIQCQLQALLGRITVGIWKLSVCLRPVPSSAVKGF